MNGQKGGQSLFSFLWESSLKKYFAANNKVIINKIPLATAERFKDV